eukprot:JP436140.1.p6 GENE.JP436140.1~~JP436140.1.p6  ORF type:complete len:63 (+),score=0.59 JP436140.1:599-787(+)
MATRGRKASVMLSVDEGAPSSGLLVLNDADRFFPREVSDGICKLFFPGRCEGSEYWCAVCRS